MNATISDGRFAVIADVSVQVEQVTDVLLRSALTLRFSSISWEELLGRYLNQIKVTLRAIAGWKWLPGQQDPLHILGVQPVTGTSNIDLVLAVERPETLGTGRMEGFYFQQELAAKLEEAAARGEMRGALAGAALISGTCSGKLDCGDMECKNTLVMEGGLPVTYNTERITLVLPRFGRTESCTCSGEHFTFSKNVILTNGQHFYFNFLKIFLWWCKCSLTGHFTRDTFQVPGWTLIFL